MADGHAGTVGWHWAVGGKMSYGGATTFPGPHPDSHPTYVVGMAELYVILVL